MANREKLTREEIRRLLVEPGSTISLKKDFDPEYTAEFLDKGEARDLLEEGIKKLADLQDRLYAENSYSLLIVIQALDAAGKDGVIKHVMSGLNPQGVQVTSFKAPSAEELDHDYLWRCNRALPERGRIGIFNRSYYEEVLVVRVHPEFLKRQQIPPDDIDNKIWARRYQEINNFEKYLAHNGTVVLKFFLNVSRKEQKKRFLERIDLPEKNWKFSAADAQERAHWNEYMQAYEDMLNATSTKWAPWYVIPADKKWYTRFAVASVIRQTMESFDLKYPTLDEDHKKELLKARRILESE
jgi:PPK2 family polyphosphate:nucleotide phosphotransferase